MNDLLTNLLFINKNGCWVISYINYLITKVSITSYDSLLTMMGDLINIMH